MKRHLSPLHNGGYKQICLIALLLVRALQRYLSLDSETLKFADSTLQQWLARSKEDPPYISIILTRCFIR